MIVWEPNARLQVYTLDKRNGWALREPDGRLWFGPGAWSRSVRHMGRAWPHSRRMRLAVEFTIAILSALASSYLILRLGL